ncbi:MAG TPA: VOC family protein [Stellaceae bacterium]|jgi:catechol 2,3-dioxygenase-like lactoylglutathione lyase family enzyme|nr:VOC family protein [Stellaceae bacterium]
MRNGIAGIDHVIVAVHDLDSARRGWTRLGFTLTPRGRHLGQGTANYCVMFPGDYLELLGFVEPDAAAARLQAFLAAREGAMSLAFAPDGPVEETAAALIALGLHPGGPRALGRQLELPEGTVVPRFTLLSLPPEETPALDCFLCAHLTPELVRRPEWLVHPNGVTGLRSVTVIAEDTAALLPAYDRLFGLHEVTTTDAVASIRSGPHRLLFATPDDFETMHPAIDLAADFPAPGIAALELAVIDREQTADYLTQWQVPFDEIPDGRLAVASREANGVVLFFVEG